jgi:hypothetical protein
MVGVVREADAPSRAIPYFFPWIRNWWRWVFVHPRAIWRIWCRSAMVLSLQTSRRRQIIGLMPNSTTLSW